MHVLVVDDRQEDRFIIKKLLKPHYTVTTLSSAREAVAFAQSHAFDVALLNAMLRTDLDGIDLLRALKVIQPETFLALACTCHSEPQRRQKLLQAGFRNVILKPFDVDVFMTLVNEGAGSAAIRQWA
ncbi:response regulator [Chryseolinea lacunae]|uniref:Response regulator n=1 Tax=Chryseolinea lacunae TaxID=2801331 RepID=A0ABS1L2K1_9BACT|nr:response regulator [Chryseolinea lacunae]MBL0744771.1 response regulator [Chryseolinea lacunae]